MVVREATQEIWRRVPNKKIRDILQKGKFPSGKRLTKREKFNARQVLKKRK